MKIKKVKVRFKVKFINIDIFDLFEKDGAMYLRLPMHFCRVDKYIGGGLTQEVCGDFNAVEFAPNAINYVHFSENTMVTPIRSEFRIYDNILEELEKKNDWLEEIESEDE